MAQNTDLYAPFATGAGANVTEDMWHSFMRRPSVTGVIRNVANELLVYADSTGMQVKIKTGEVWIEGHWGGVTVEKIHPITAAHATLVRMDRVVARLNLTTKVVETDVKDGTAGAGVAPGLTRTSTVYEVSLGVVNVPATDTSIDAAQVLDARTFGGSQQPNVTDDNTFYGDKMSSCPRLIATNIQTPANGDLYFVRMTSLVDQVISKVRMYTEVAQISGSNSVRIYKGFRQDDLALVVDTGLSFIGTSGTVHEQSFTPFIAEAGMTVVVTHRCTGAGTLSQLGTSQPCASANLLNPFLASNMVTGSKTAAIPGATLNIIDSSWTKRDRTTWIALG